ncbi:tyw5 [Symbiodinium natans]|uniref:Tyw5 protein n=1 Tax=Symbiodinium natans TaxID=878477 RepID=A0A812LB30_9DINO|nr:tyw5 [Symbiodinium natans]
MPALTKTELPLLPNVDASRGQQRKAFAWQEIAAAVAGPLKQICGARPDGQRMLEATLRNVPIKEDEPFPGLPCVAFSLGGIAGASQSFMDLSGSPLEDLLGADLKRAPLHGLLPMAQNKRINLEAWTKLEQLHSRTFAGASRLKASRRAVVADGLEENKITSSAVEVTEEEEEEMKSVTMSLLLSPMRQGKPFWNLVSAFKAEVFREILVLHVLMPISASVPGILWQEDAKASSAIPGPIQELLPYVDPLMHRLRSKLSELQQQEAQHAVNVEGSMDLAHLTASPKSPTRRRASDVGPLGTETMPILASELLRPTWTRQFSEGLDSVCSELPDLTDLWGAQEQPMLAGSTVSLDLLEFSENVKRRPRVLEVVEKRCRNLARALGDNVFSGIHFVPRFGSAMSLPYEVLKFGEEVLEKESEELVSQWKWGDRHHRKEKFYEVPFMILDPDEVDCPIAYMSKGLEDLTGYFRAWALGRHFRFMLLPDALQNRVFNSQELGRIDEFCCNQNKDAPNTPTISTTRVCWDFKASDFLDRSQRSSSPKRKRVGQPPPSKDLDVPCRMLSLLRLFVPKSKSPVWSCFYLRHVWLQDPSILDPAADFGVKHFIFVVVLPLYTQMPALEDLLTMDALETNFELGQRVRELLTEKSHNVALKEREAISILDSVVPAWLRESGRGVPSCMIGWHFVPRIGLAAVRDFQGSWPRLAKTLFKLNPEPTGANVTEQTQTIDDEEDGILCWVADASMEGLPLVFISQSLQKLTGYSSDFALARNVRLFQPKKQRIDQAINNEELDADRYSLVMINKSTGHGSASALSPPPKALRKLPTHKRLYLMREPAPEDECDVRTLQYDSPTAASALAEHLWRNVPLRLTGVPKRAEPELSDARLRALGHRTVELRQMAQGGQVAKKAAKHNASLADALAGGPLAGRFYAAQVSIPNSLPELEASSLLSGELAEAWQNGTRGALSASPYLYYHGGGGEPGPSLYLHYDAADNLVQVLDGTKDFWLYDPFQAAQLLYGSNSEHGNASPINVESPSVYEDYPYFRFAVPRRCRVRTGQWLYVPLYWWHAVRSGPGRTVSLAHFAHSTKKKKGIFEKFLCGYSVKGARFDCGSTR